MANQRGVPKRLIALFAWLGALASIATVLSLLYISGIIQPFHPGTSVSATATSAHTTRQVTVQANLGWQSTGISLSVGDRAVISYVSGGWIDDVNTNQPPFDGNGAPSQYVCANYIPAAQCVEPVPDFPRGALVGKVGTQLLKIGNHLSFTAEQSGELMLRMNDGDPGLYDNAGAIIVSIQVMTGP